MEEEGSSANVDPGLAVFVALLRFQGLGIDPAQIRHRFGEAALGIPEMLRSSKELGLRARSHNSS